jgi:serine phosphatase RsbU (regulator of sigma subunit)/pSer/pThr/pTyr-binding forkhead associated (FHA) protein
MAELVAIKGANAGQRFTLAGDSALIGRQPDVDVYLESLAVSRQHARILREAGGYFIEDVGSSNGTFLNGTRITGRTPLTENDLVQIGPYVLGLRQAPPASEDEANGHIIRARVEAQPSNRTLFSQNPAYKLQVVLEIAQHLGHTLEVNALLNKLLEQLFRLFPQADRGMVLLCERDHDTVRAQRTRQKGERGDYPYSRTLVRQALEEGVGLLSENVGEDNKLVLSATLLSLKLRSFLCVPLIGWEGKRLGVIQLDCLCAGQVFRAEDLELLTAIGLQVAVVLENVALHAEVLREERLRQEVLLARDIQQAFLPTDFAVPGVNNAELFARVHPAREVSGDLYDFFPLPDGRLAFFVGDVSGKGMPAALYMIAVRSLARHLAPTATGPAEMLRLLNAALAADNPTALYVTLAHGVYDDRDGSVTLASGGHPPPLLRHVDGQIEEVALRPGLILGSSPVYPMLPDTRVVLQPGETMILYTDGFTEGFAPDGKTMFGLERLREVLSGPRTELPLEQCAQEASAAVRRFTGQDELQDDQTLLLLRRR